MWGLPWEQCKYRLENLSERDSQKIRKGEQAQSEMRRCLLAEEPTCTNCHKEPVVFAALGGLCATCGDYILE